MTQVGFYHLTRDSAAAALPRLLGRTLDAGARAVVLCGDAPRVKVLDDALWQAPDPPWLPHGSTQAKGVLAQADLQPVWLTERDEPDAANGAGYLFLLDGRETAHPQAYSRIFDLFDGADAEAVAAARQRWSRLKAEGHGLTYWQQGPRGWTQGATSGGTQDATT